MPAPGPPPPEPLTPEEWNAVDAIVAVLDALPLACVPPVLAEIEQGLGVREIAELEQAADSSHPPPSPATSATTCRWSPGTDPLRGQWVARLHQPPGSIVVAIPCHAASSLLATGYASRAQPAMVRSM
jgi:hypothetical protein